MPEQAKKRFGVYQRACFQGKKKENTYTPKSLQGVRGGPLRAALVYRFWPPIFGPLRVRLFFPDSVAVAELRFQNPRFPQQKAQQQESPNTAWAVL